MDTRSKKYNRGLYYFNFWLCVLSLLAAMGTIMLSFGFDEAFNIGYGFGIWEVLFPSEYGFVFSDNIQSLRITMATGIISAVVCSILCIISCIYCIVKVGERDENGKVIVQKVDMIPTELQILIFFTLLVMGAVLCTGYLYEGIARTVAVYFEGLVRVSYYYHTPKTVAFSLAGSIGFISASIGFWMLVSMIRKLKARTFIKYSIFGWVFLNPLKALISGTTIMKKVMLCLLAICIGSATVFLAPIALIVIVLFAPKKVRMYEQIKKGVTEVSSGNFSYKIPIEGKGELESLAEGINKISEASSIAIENELKNQKMKTELISNVSHDLKTPLTSLVTYIDLLKKEGLDSENALQYLEILEQKTIRLKQLTEDLFEAAKASSGAIPINLTKVDVVSLINQTLGELEEKIESSALEFILNSTEEKHYAKADGQQLWRVVENLVVNALKYAQDGSRVYIDIKDTKEINGSKENLSNSASILQPIEQEKADLINKGNIIIEIKNVSKNQLNIDANTLMERFTRGDDARSTEGSGLGLAISKDLVRLMGGTFDIVIDGDLFKVRVCLPKYEQTKMEEKPHTVIDVCQSENVK